MRLPTLLPILCALCLLASCTTRTATQTGNAMLPNIGHGDRLTYTTVFDSLDYGDLVIFRFPGDEELIYPLGPVVLRVVGLPGDTIAVEDFVCVLNGVKNDCSFVRTLLQEEDSRTFGRTEVEALSSYDDYEEVFPNGRRIKFRTFSSDFDDDISDVLPELVPPSHYFLMGDFRGNALDSRLKGSIPVDRILGKVVKIREK